MKQVMTYNLILSGHYTIKISFLLHSKQEGKHADTIQPITYQSDRAVQFLDRYRTTATTTDPFIHV
jgi:hypothetical protein